MTRTENKYWDQHQEGDLDQHQEGDWDKGRDWDGPISVVGRRG